MKVREEKFYVHSVAAHLSNGRFSFWGLHFSDTMTVNEMASNMPPPAVKVGLRLHYLLSSNVSSKQLSLFTALQLDGNKEANDDGNIYLWITIKCVIYNDCKFNIKKSTLDWIISAIQWQIFFTCMMENTTPWPIFYWGKKNRTINSLQKESSRKQFSFFSEMQLDTRGQVLQCISCWDSPFSCVDRRLMEGEFLSSTNCWVSEDHTLGWLDLAHGNTFIPSRGFTTQADWSSFSTFVND